MKEVELVIEGVTGPFNQDFGLDLYVNAKGELKLFIHNEYDSGEAKLSKEQAIKLSNALMEYVNGQDENITSD